MKFLAFAFLAFFLFNGLSAVTWDCPAGTAYFNAYSIGRNDLSSIIVNPVAPFSFNTSNTSLFNSTTMENVQFIRNNNTSDSRPFFVEQVGNASLNTTFQIALGNTTSSGYVNITICTGNTLSSNYSNRTATTSGLLRFYPLTDLSETNSSLNLNGTRAVASSECKYGGCYSVNQTGANLTAIGQGMPSGDGNYSVCFWAKINTKDNSNWYRVWAFGNSTNYTSFASQDTSNKIYYNVQGSNVPSTGVSYTAATWLHWCVAHSTGGSNVIYLSGASAGSASKVAALSASPLWIGTDVGGANPYPFGNIDDFKIWGRNLTGDEVKFEASRNYTSPPANEPAAPSTCNGSISTPNTIVNLNASCTQTSGTAFNITAANVTINCAGYSITGTNTTSTYGIYSNQFNTTVKNCIISNFGMGILFNNVTNGTIQNTTANTTNGGIDGITSDYGSGLLLYNSSFNTVNNSSAFSLYGNGFSVAINSYWNNANNISARTGHVSGAALLVACTSGFNTFRNANVLTDDGATITDKTFGIAINGGFNNTFTNYTISSAGTSCSGTYCFYPLFLEGLCSNVFNNTFTGGNITGRTGTTQPLLSVTYSASNVYNNTFYANNFSSNAGSTYVLDNSGGLNSYNSSTEGNIWFNVQNGTVNITGNVSSSFFPSLYIGMNGTGYPYNSTTSSMVSSGVVDWHPLTPYLFSSPATNATIKIVSQISFSNYSASHQFNVTATANNTFNATDFTATNISTTAGTCTYLSNSTSGVNLTVIYNCTATTPSTPSIKIGFTGTEAYNETNAASNAFPDHAASLTKPSLNSQLYNTSVATCTNGVFSDLDGDSENTSARGYQWYKNGTLTNQTSQTLLLSLISASAGDNISCSQNATANNWTASFASNSSTNTTISSSTGSWYDSTSATYGNGSDGSLVFTASTKSYGNLVLSDDYNVSGNTLYLNLNRAYQFTNMTLGTGTTITSGNANGTVLYILVNGVSTINATMNFSTILTQGNNAGSTFVYGNDTIPFAGVAGNYSGFGSGGNGGSVASGAGGSGGAGGYPNGTGGASRSSACTTGLPGYDGGVSAGGSGGIYDSLCSGEPSVGGAGGNGYGSNGGAATVKTGGGYPRTAGGGGGGGGNAGISGVHILIKAINLTHNATFITSGTNGGNAGNGGNGAFAGQGAPEAYANGGNGGIGGGGGSGGIIALYYSIGSGTSTYQTNAGNGGTGGIGGAGYVQNSDPGNDGGELSAAHYGSNGSNGSSGTSGGVYLNEVTSAPYTPTVNFTTGTYRNDTFNASCSGTDPQGFSLTYYYKFSSAIGNILQNYSANSSYSLCSGNSACNKTYGINVSCKSDNGYLNSSEAIAFRAISNLAPSIPTGDNVSNSTQSISSTVNATCSGSVDSDPEDSITYYYRIYSLNDSINRSEFSTNSSYSFAATNDSHDTFRYDCYAFDGSNISATRNGTANISLANTAPSTPSILAVSTSADYITVNCSVTDLDGATDISLSNITSTSGTVTPISNGTNFTLFWQYSNITGLSSLANINVSCAINDSYGGYSQNNSSFTTTNGDTYGSETQDGLAYLDSNVGWYLSYSTVGVLHSCSYAPSKTDFTNSTGAIVKNSSGNMVLSAANLTAITWNCSQAASPYNITFYTYAITSNSTSLTGAALGNNTVKYDILRNQTNNVQLDLQVNFSQTSTNRKLWKCILNNITTCDAGDIGLWIQQTFNENDTGTGIIASRTVTISTAEMVFATTNDGTSGGVIVTGGGGGGGTTIINQTTEVQATPGQLPEKIPIWSDFDAFFRGYVAFASSGVVFSPNKINGGFPVYLEIISPLFILYLLFTLSVARTSGGKSLLGEGDILLFLLWFAGLVAYWPV